MAEEKPFDEKEIRGITIKNAFWIISLIAAGIIQFFAVMRMIQDTNSKLDNHIVKAEGDKEVRDLQIETIKASLEAYKAEVERMKQNSK